MGCKGKHKDTYIERVFNSKVDNKISEENLREVISSSWKNDKINYANKLKTVAFEFMHYSLHDESHSRSILDTIELLLGRQLIRQLSVCDLWLLLEAAYSHDIGMCTSLDELCELWKDENEIKKIIAQIEQTDDSPVIDDFKELLDHCKDGKNREVLSKLQIKKDWPVQVRKAVMYIDSYYIRQRHAQRSKEYILNNLCRNGQIESRVYKLVADIDRSHGDEFKNIITYIPKIEVGFETEKAHPLFIALLLRVGDVLDLRNNRFNEAYVDYQGGLVGESAKHYAKHKAVKHFLVSQDRVEIKIESDEMSTCINARAWLDIVDNELHNLINSWSKYSPSHFPGPRLKDIDLKVYHRDVEFLPGKSSLQFRVNSINVVTLLTGRSIYDTSLIFLREYIQNAYDAMKIRVGMDLQHENEYWLKDIKLKLNDLTPKDIRSSYFSKYRLKIFVSVSNNSDQSDIGNDEITIEIADEGIGMDEDGINSLLTVGSGWGIRQNVNNIYYSIPNWLKPTGGFGIGILSGFLIADIIEIRTKTKGNPGYNLIMNSPSIGGKIYKSIDPSITKIGTTISLKIPFFKYYKEIIKMCEKGYYDIKDFIERKEKDGDFDLSDFHIVVGNREQFVIKSLQALCEHYLIDTPFFIQILDTNYRFKKDIGYITNKDLFLKMRINEFDEYEIDNKKDEFRFVEWDIKNEAFVRYNFYKLFEKNKKDIRWGYKSIYVKSPIGTLLNTPGLTREEEKKKEAVKRKLDLITPCVDIIDYWSSSVTKLLKISREEFRNYNTITPIIDDILLRVIDILFGNEEFHKKLLDACLKDTLHNKVMKPRFIKVGDSDCTLVVYLYKLARVVIHDNLNVDKNVLDDMINQSPKTALIIRNKNDYHIVTEIMDLLKNVRNLRKISPSIYNKEHNTDNDTTETYQQSIMNNLRILFNDKIQDAKDLSMSEYKSCLDKCLKVVEKKDNVFVCLDEVNDIIMDFLDKICVSVIADYLNGKKIVAVNENYSGGYLASDAPYYYVFEKDDFDLLWYTCNDEDTEKENIIRLSSFGDREVTTETNDSVEILNKDSFKKDVKYFKFDNLSEEQWKKYEAIILKSSSVFGSTEIKKYYIMNPFVVTDAQGDVVSIDDFYNKLTQFNSGIDWNNYFRNTIKKEKFYNELTNIVYKLKRDIENEDKYTLNDVKDQYVQLMVDMLKQFEELEKESEMKEKD